MLSSASILTSEASSLLSVSEVHVLHPISEGVLSPSLASVVAIPLTKVLVISPLALDPAVIILVAAILLLLAGIQISSAVLSTLLLL